MGRKIDRLREVVLVVFLIVGVPLVGVQIWRSVGGQSVQSVEAGSQAAKLDTTATPDTTNVILKRPDSFNDF